MPRRRSDEVVIDPVAAAEQLGAGQPAAPTEQELDDAAVNQAAQDAGPVPEPVVVTVTPDPAALAACALGHSNVASARFCAECGLTMDAPAPVARVSLDDARPKPVSQLSAEERAERDRQHADALAAARQFEAQQAVYVPPEGETVLIHFVEDGLTFAGQVWYRGQEIEIGPAHPRWEQARQWILLDKYAQIERYGKQFFDRGPWPGRRSYLDGAEAYEQLRTEDRKGKFAGPGEEALRQADERERARGRAVPGMAIR